MTERGYKIYTYGGDDFTRCKLGKFKEVGAIENILKFFVKEAEKEKIDQEILVHYSRRDPETHLLEEKIIKS